MQDSMGIFCRLCLNTVIKDFTVIDQSTKEMLRTLSPNMESVDNYKHVICSFCSVKLYAAFDFKYTCLYVEDRITSYVDPKVSFVDLREVYLKEQNGKTVKMKDDQRICRLCLQLVKKRFVSFQEINLEMINNYIPELNFGVTQDPVVCQQCFDSLRANETFIRTCLDVERKIRNTNDKIKFTKCKNDEIKLGNEEIKERIIKIENEPETAKMLIKSEEIDIKVEEELESDFPHNRRIESTQKQLSQDTGGTNHEYKFECETNVLTNRCKKKRKFDSILKHKVLTHKDCSEVQMYKCNMCDFETKHKGNLKIHQLIHKDCSEVQMYKCNVCDFETKHKGNLKIHQLIHKDCSEVQMYKCNVCDFEAKRKGNLKVHQLTHKDCSEVQMYKCNVCDFETKRKDNLKNHQLIHKDYSEVELYKCDICSYVTKFKGSLKLHQLTHKDPSEIHMYKCDVCTFESKNKRLLKSHQLAHKHPSKIQTYICDECDTYSYATKYKCNLKKHQLKHKNPSEIQMYKCDKCSFESKYKVGVRKHQARHKDPSEK